MAKRHRDETSQWKSMEQVPFQYDKVGVGEVQELGHASVRPAFTVWWNNGKIAKNLSLNEKKIEFRGSEKRGNEASYGGYEEISMHEVWKRQQVHDDARKMYRTETSD